MSERGILFSAPMVRAILAGEKIETRRVIKPQPAVGSSLPLNIPETPFWELHYPPQIMSEGRDTAPLFRCPYGVPGDRLWVRETHAFPANLDPYPASCIDADWAAEYAGHTRYRASQPDRINSQGRWRPSIFMPRWASRITLRITDVRVERLHEIDNNGAYREGTPDLRTMEKNWDLRDCYRVLWESINGPGSWDLDPWVWVLTFERRDDHETE